MLCSDTESNLGHDMDTVLAEALATVQRTEKGQANISSELAALSQRGAQVGVELKPLSVRICAVEADKLL